MTWANLQDSVYFSSVGNSWKKPEERLDRPAVNITREDFGGMILFADSEIEKIPGAIMDDNVVIIGTVHSWTTLS
jgi:hypothetical protein